MNKKILFLGAIISSCVIAFISGQSMADYRNPNMPTGGYKSYKDGSYSPYSYGSQGSSSYSQYPQYNYGYSGGDSNMGSPKLLQTQSAEKFTGTISSMNRVQYPDGTQIEMVLETSDGTKRIMVGPSKFLDQSKIKVQAGDKVTVTGYRVGANGNEVIVAQEINKNGNMLQLRNDQRQPLWQQPSYMWQGGSPYSDTPGMMGPSYYTSNPNPYSPVNRGY